MEDMKVEVHDPREERRLMGGEAREGSTGTVGMLKTHHIFSRKCHHVTQLNKILFQKQVGAGLRR